MVKFKNSCEIKVFNQPFENEDHAIENLKSFDALLIMRERTPMTKKLMDGCPNLKFIATSGMRNLGIDLEHAKSKELQFLDQRVIKSYSRINLGFNFGSCKEYKTRVKNMYQGYWQTTIGFELKGKTLGIMGLGKLGSMVAKVGKAFGMEVIAWSENLKMADGKTRCHGSN